MGNESQNHELGTSIITAINTIKGSDIEVQETKTKKGKVYTFGNDRYRVKVTIGEKWLGLDFVLTGSKLWYPINTDLYDITQEKYKKFAKEVESNIVSFLDNLKNGKFKIAYQNSRPMLLIPVKDEYILLKQGRFLSSKSIFKTLQEVQSKGDFAPFVVL
jgi:hypothetical protein